MRVTHTRSQFGRFGSMFRTKYGLTPVGSSLDKPCVFFGLYGKQVERMLIHKAPAIVIWAGSDASAFLKNEDYVRRFKERPETYVCARSDFIVRDMESIGVSCKKVPILPVDNSDITPKPLGDKVYIYKPNSIKYGRDINRALMHELKYIDVVTTGPNTYNRDDLLKVYESCFMGVRCINHDGNSNTVAEMSLMGRPVIWNGGAPHCYRYTNVDDVLETVQRLYEQRGEFDYSGLAKSAYEYYDIGDGFLDTDYYS